MPHREFFIVATASHGLAVGDIVTHDPQTGEWARTTPLDAPPETLLAEGVLRPTAAPTCAPASSPAPDPSGRVVRHLRLLA